MPGRQENAPDFSIFSSKSPLDPQKHRAYIILTLKNKANFIFATFATVPKNLFGKIAARAGKQ